MLQLTRLGFTLAAVSNCWVMLFLAVSLEPESRLNEDLSRWSLGLLLLFAAAVAAGLHGYGAALNDLLDVRRDRLLHPRRPLPSGRLSVQQAVGIAVLCLLVAILAAVAMGTGPVLVCLLTAAGILFYNLTGKHLPATGIVMLGLIRMVGMFIPNPQLGFAWPVVLAMTHTTFAAAVVYRLEDKRPRLRPSERGGIFAGWAFWTLVLLGWMSVFDGMNLPNEPLVWVGPAVAAAIFAAGSWAFLYRAQRRPGGRTALAGYYARGSTAWLVAYDATWLLSSGQWWPGILHLALLATACASVLAYRPGQDEGRDELPYVVST